MTVFGDNYSQYYDLLYKDKDYSGEVAYVDRLIRKYLPEGALSLLELGCGTGKHAELLAEMGYIVCGVEKSSAMLEIAQARTARKEQLSFALGDITAVDLGRCFDCATSLFHVISYQVSNTQLRAAFATVRKHLRVGGIFVFDFWYGPAVLTDRPTVRVKRLRNDLIEVIRIAEPVMYPDENRVDVNYQVLIKNLTDGCWGEHRETHSMRYLFLPELEVMLGAEGFAIVSAAEWMSEESPSPSIGFESWNATVIARAME